MEYVIVGAGLSGLHLGNALQQNKINYLILEKSKGLGGRIATRRIDELGLDHGALYLDEKPSSLNSLFEQTDRGYFTPGGMNQIAKSLARDLKIQKEQKLSQIKKSTSGWLLKTEEGLELETQNLILTAPLPQALELLEKNGLAPKKDHELYSIQYTKALILLAILESCEGFKSTIFENHEFQLMKERNLHPQGLVIQCSPEFSEHHFENPEMTSLSAIADFIKQSPFASAKIEKSELKKWRYSRPLKTFPQPFIELHPNLFLCGDGFGLPLQSSQLLINRLL